VGEDEGCDEDIDVDREFREIKAAGGRRSALDWSWFRRPFHSDCNYGEVCPYGGHRAGKRTLGKAWQP
jgi:hypothetical protein